MTSPKQRGKPGALVAVPSSAAGSRPHTGQRGTKAIGSPKRPLPHAAAARRAPAGSATAGGSPPHMMIAKRMPLRIVEAQPLDMDVDRSRPRSVSPTTSD
jgi:hypothetical protein